jgi:lysophospholipase L1-like esterase
VKKQFFRSIGICAELLQAALAGLRAVEARYPRVMRVRMSVIVGFCAIHALLLLATPFEGAAQTKAGTNLGPPASPHAIPTAGTLSTMADASKPSPPTIAQPGSLVSMFDHLYHLNAGQDPTPIHILHFGDSHSAADDWTAGLRSQLKERFGDGGSGFSLAGKPFQGYRRFDVQGGGSAGWHAEGLRSGTGDGYFGMGGVSSSTQVEGQSVFIETECDRLEIYYLQQPGGGDLALYDHDRLLEKFSTKGELGPGFVSYQTTSGAHRFVLRTLNSKPVRLFGWVADKETGVTYEALGINGAEASVILRWNENMLATYLRRRNPGLIVLAYGTNEAANASWNSEKYQAMFSDVIQRFRRAVPAASILVLGPPDSWSNRQGTWRPLPGIDRIIAAQKSACRENGCGFWDTRERMGGLGSMPDWVQAGLAQHDHIHFTPAGYRRLAAMLFADMMRQYELFKEVRLEISDTASPALTSQDH